jgi:hypothetical protein
VHDQVPNISTCNAPSPIVFAAATFEVQPVLMFLRTACVLLPCREEYVSAFTRSIYFQGIAVSVAFGDNAPLVGHNAFLRWSALRAVSTGHRFLCCGFQDSGFAGVSSLEQISLGNDLAQDQL